MPGGGNVGHPSCLIERRQVTKAFQPLGLGIAQVKLGRDAPEQVGRQNQEALAGQIVTFCADCSVDAEDFLQEHNTRTGAAKRLSEIAGHRLAFAGDLHPPGLSVRAHGSTLPKRTRSPDLVLRSSQYSPSFSIAGLSVKLKITASFDPVLRCRCQAYEGITKTSLSSQ